MVYTETTPRGPVAAQYNSPGPIYALPPLVGDKNHDPQSTHDKRPAYSFGVRHGKMKDEASPGPVYYPDARFSRTGLDKSPRYSLYGRPRDLKSWAHATPGPGAYTPRESSPQASPRGYSFGLKTNYKGKDSTPGPNIYHLPSLLGQTVDSTKRQSPMYSQRSRSNKGGFHEDLKRTPGPGTYSVIPPGVYKYNSPSYSMTGKTKVVGDNTLKPGPGAHNPEDVTIHLRRDPGVPLGIRHSPYKVNPVGPHDNV